MVPINVYEKKLNYLARTFGYAKGSLSFAYLGLPLVLQPKLEELLPLYK